MDNPIMTDPFTGLAIDALIMKDGKNGYESFINTRNNMQFPIVKIDDIPCVAIPLEEFHEPPLVASSEAREILNVSKARIAQVVKLGRLQPTYIQGKQFFNKPDLLQYKNSRYKRRTGNKEEE